MGSSRISICGRLAGDQRQRQPRPLAARTLANLGCRLGAGESKAAELRPAPRGARVPSSSGPCAPAASSRTVQFLYLVLGEIAGLSILPEAFCWIPAIVGQLRRQQPRQCRPLPLPLRPSRARSGHQDRASGSAAAAPASRHTPPPPVRASPAAGATRPGLGNSKRSEGSSISSAIGWSLASAFWRDWACLAVEARAELRAM